MTKFFNNFKKNIFGPFIPISGQIFFQKLRLYHSQFHIGFKHYTKI